MGLSVCALQRSLTASFADDTGTQIKNTAEDLKTSTRVGVRNFQQEARKVVGTDNAAKDAQDSADNLHDQAAGAAAKAKNEEKK